MEVEDDWDMTVEELDSLERDAFLLLNNSMCTNSNSTIFQNHLLPTLPTKPHFRFPSSKVSGRRTTHSVFVLQSRWTLCLKEKSNNFCFSENSKSFLECKRKVMDVPLSSL
ncbi:uncharacterized protein DS421_13g440720 [Arachis hypogaea]|nr:uncharacterized protein DS421_13g440720 [Arachis hypogaea]